MVLSGMVWYGMVLSVSNEACRIEETIKALKLANENLAYCFTRGPALKRAIAA